MQRTISAFLLLLSICGCAGYEGSVRDVRAALLAGEKERALGLTNELLEVETSDAFPDDVSGDNALLVLERGTIKQGQGAYESSSLDFRESDKHLELLDLKNDTMGNIGKFLFSDDTTVYKAPAYEKLLLNTFNLLNYLAQGQLEEARVESRRLAVMQDYLKDEESEQDALLGLGSYLAGFAFEMSGRHEEALRFYDEVLAESTPPSLQDPIARLAGCSTFRTDRLNGFLKNKEVPQGCRTTAEGKGTVLVISLIGLAPYKSAKRFPIGAAFAIAANAMHGPGLTPSDRARADKMVARGLLTWINFPVMNRSVEQFVRPEVEIDGAAVPAELGLNVTERVIEAWNSIKGTLMVAAITRMLTRLVAGEVTEQATKSGGAGGALALLARVAVQGTLTAADTPDTRSWVTLPSKVFITRVEVEAGQHLIDVDFVGQAGRARVSNEVDVPQGGYVVVPVISMR